MGDPTTPIAVIGMGCRLSGDAVEPEKLFSMCADRRDGWSTLPKDRLNPDGWYHPHQGRHGATNAPGGYFIKEDLGAFDAHFFNITAAEAAALDPQQRLLLEICYETMENAGIRPERLVGSNTSVFVGSLSSDYKAISAEDSGLTMPMYYPTGIGGSMLANRLSYFYDLRGPSIMLDTACSSSLGGLYLACQSLISGNSEQAIVGGSNVILDPRCWSSMSAMRFLSPDGRCFSFDHRANGYARGEGTACVMLKPLDAAIRDGNTIRSVIRHVGTNQDGKTMGITLPSKTAQESLIRRLYAEAGLKTSETSYLETHGTGTQAGDPLEAGAIASVFAKDRALDDPLIIGSVKTNVGHTEGLSGLAALIKTVLMLEHRVIVPNCNFEKPNANIPLRDWKLRVPTEAEPWSVSGPRRASLNNFGFGGSNFHAILEDAEGYLAARGLSGKYRQVYGTNGVNGVHETNGFTNGTNGTHEIVNGANGTNGTHKILNGTNGTNGTNGIANGTNGVHQVNKTPKLFVLSAFHEAMGKEQTSRLKSYLEERLKEHVGDQFAEDLSYTLAEHRTHHTWRKAVMASSLEDLHNALQPDSVKFFKSKKAARLGFVFTGQGAQWYAMGRELMSQYPVFLSSIQRSQESLHAMGAPWSLIDELTKDEATSQLGHALLAQPACTAIQVALVDLLETWGVRPAAVVGHSSGEIAGAYACGAITHEGAMLISYHRGVLAASIKPKHPELNGAMIAAGLTPETAGERIAKLTRGRLTVACVNSPQSVTIAGDSEAVDELQAALQEEGVFNRKLRVEVAYHSHHMQVVAEEYLAALSGLKVSAAVADKCSFYSSVRGKKVEGSQLGPQYWVDNMVSTVQFASALKALCLDTRGKRRPGSSSKAVNVGSLIEVGPHAALAGPIKEIMKLDTTLSGSGITYNSVLHRKRDAAMTAMELASFLFESGYEVDFAAINRPGTTETPDLVVDLPPFAWDHTKRYWAESRTSKQLRLKKEPRADLLGSPSVDSTALEPRWRNMIRGEEVPWVRDHVVQSNIVYPGAGYICMAIEAASRRAAANGAGVQAFKLRNIVISQALVIPEESSDIEIQIALRPLNDSVKALSKTWDEWCVQSLSGTGMWVENCRGLISTVKAATSEDESLLTNDAEEQAFYTKELESLRASCRSEVDTRVIYTSLAELGLEYGPTFANMKTARATPDACVATVSIADTAATQPSGFQYPHILHPTTLDALFHTVFPCDADPDGKVPHAIILTGIDELFVSSSLSAEPGHEFNTCTRTERVDDATRQGTALVFDGADEGRGPVVVIKGIKYIPHDKEAQDEGAQDAEPHAMHEVVWQPDVNFPAPERDAVYPPLTVPAEEVGRSLDLQKAAYYYSEEALQHVGLDEVAEDHHKALWRWMERITSMVRGDEFDYPTAQWTSATNEEKAAFLLANSTASDEARLLAAIGTNLASILRGTTPPLSVMMEDGLLGKFYENNITGNGPLEVCPPYIEHLAHKNPHLRILEIGAGTGGMTSPVLRVLGGADGTTPRFAEYVYTDISSAFFEGAREKFKEWSHLIQYRKLDIEAEPSKQGYEVGHFDVVIAHNVLHATTQIKRTLKHVRSLLKPGGRLLLSEITGEKLSIGLVWGTLPGWWAGMPEGRVNGPLLTEDGWASSLQDSGFSGIELALSRSIPHHSLRQGTFMVSRAEEPELEVPREITLVAEDGLDRVQLGAMKAELESLGSMVHSTSLAGVEHASGQFFIILSELAGPILRAPSEQQFAALKRLLCDCEGALWVSEGANMGASNPDTSLFGGLANSLRTEVGGSAHISLDLDGDSDRCPEETTSVIMRVLREAFRVKQSGKSVEVTYAERAGVIYAPRVIDEHNFRSAFAVESQPPAPTDQPYNQEGRPLVPRLRVPGLLDTIYFDDAPNAQGALADDHIRIEVKASGLNFHDIMTSMGQIKSSHMGFEAAGIITAVGKDVHDLAVGDRVVALGHDLLTNVAHVPRTHAHKFPDSLSFETAASLPVVYTTAYYSLFNLARVQPGDRVLVHAAAGGLGHAAIDVCRHAGAEVFATVSTREKKDLLMSRFGVPADHIFSSRRPGFGEGIRRVSGGAGVDIVLNSLSGDFVRESLGCMAPLGRFIELGRHDFLVNSRLEMAGLRNNITFVVADLLMIVDERPTMIMPALQEVLRLVGEGDLKVSLPHSTFSMAEMEGALRTMQTGRHTGKLVAVPRADDVVKVMPGRETSGILRPDASYVLVGGSGGLGQAQAHWMVSVGAKNLILASRSGSSNPEVKGLIDELRDQGVNVVALRCDVSNAEEVKALVAYAKVYMPPIRGLVHGGMVLRDTLFGRMTLQQWQEVLGPKVQGTWNLHHLLPHEDLDFFIMLSSIVGVRGNASQGAYSAGGAFQDAFAHYRRSKGLPALALDLGKIDEVGYVAERSAETAKRLDESGVSAMSKRQFLAALKVAVSVGTLAPPQVITGLRTYQPDRALPEYDVNTFSALRRTGEACRTGGGDEGATAARPRDALRQAGSVEEATAAFCAAFVDKMSSLLMVAVDNIDFARSINEYGMDSLVAVEMRNWLFKEMDITVPILELLANQSLTHLTSKLIEKSKLTAALFVNGSAST